MAVGYSARALEAYFMMGGGWTPESPTSDGGYSPHVWYDANQISGLNDSDPCATWADVGPNGDDLTQGTANLRPLYKTTILNSFPVVRFDGSNDYLQGAFTNAGQLTKPCFFFIVAAMDAADVNDGNLHFLTDGDDNSLRVACFQHSSYTPDAWSVYNGNNIVGGDSDSDWNIWSVLLYGASSQFWHNGVSEASGNAGGGGGPDGLTVGTNYDGNNAFKGDVAEIVVYDANLSTADHNEVGNYLADKYGLSWTTLT